MIKTIHYIWLGGKKKPRLVKTCIASWKKYMPDWNIVEWNEKNLNININQFSEEAYKAKKYAFVADVLRFHILLAAGGLYFDTDVLMKKSLQPLIDKEEAFSGYELSGKVNPGLVLYAPQPGDPAIRETLELYNKTSFIKDDGTYNLCVVGDYFASVLTKYGSLSPNECKLLGTVRLYPATYFAPIDDIRSQSVISENTYTIHLYAASWQTKSQKRATLIRKILYSVLSPYGVSLCKKVIGYKK